MIARARAITHGNAYTTYSTLKRDAEFVCCENMAGDMTMAVTVDDLDSIWMQFKYAGENHLSMGKPVTRNLIAMEVSPTKEESEGWALEQWNQFAHQVIEEMDKVEFKNKEGKVSSRRTDFAHSKWLAMLHHDAKSGIPHLHFMISRFTLDGRVNDTNLIGLKATMTANSINQRMGWRQSKDISEEHKEEIKDAIYDILRTMERFDWDEFLRKIKERGYDAEVKRDSKEKVVGYRVMRGHSRYNASQIGRKLSANHIESTWKQLHDEMDAAKAEYEEKHHLTCEPIRKGTPIVHLEYDRSIEDGKDSEHFSFDVSKKIIDAFCDTFNEFGNKYMFDLEQVLEESVFIFFELLTIETGESAHIGGGGHPKDLSKRKKHDDGEDEIDRAKGIARSVVKKCPKKVTRYARKR